MKATRRHAGISILMLASATAIACWGGYGGGGSRPDEETPPDATCSGQSPGAEFGKYLIRGFFLHNQCGSVDAIYWANSEAEARQCAQDDAQDAQSSAFPVYFVGASETSMFWFTRRCTQGTTCACIDRAFWGTSEANARTCAEDTMGTDCALLNTTSSPNHRTTSYPCSCS